MSFEFYNKDGAKLIDKLSVLSKDINVEIEKARGVEIRLIVTLLEKQYELASYYMWMIQAPYHFGLSEKFDVLVQAFHKNLLAMVSALELTRNGFHGSAKLLLRHIFEYLIIAKFCSLSPDDKVYTSWKNEEVVYFTNAILKKIKSPNPAEFQRFWSEINEFSHASRSSLQVALDWNTEKKSIENNLVILQVLLECNYHLLNRHIITDSMRWDMSYNDAEKYKEIVKIKTYLNELFSISKRMLGKSSRRLIYDYKRKWTF